MTIPEARPAVLKRLGSVLESVRENTYSDFYRKRLSALGEGFPRTLAAWQALPLLTREDIKQTPFWERVFVPRVEIFGIRNTAGSSEKVPLFTPRRTFGDYASTPAKAGVRRMLSFTLAWYLSETLRREHGAVTMNCDYPETIEDYERAARLACAFGVDSLFVFPSVAVNLAPYLAAQGILENIRVLELYGERCSQAQLEVLRARYNEPAILQNYSASETAGVFGLACSHTIRHSLASFHIASEYFFCEFIDPESGEPADPRNGPAELILTSYTDDQPFPLIRYRTGDLLRVEAESCRCEYASPRFEVVGRAGADRVRFLPGEISLRSIEQALARVHGIRTDEFEAHIVEERHLGTWKPGVRLFVLPEKDADLGRVAIDIAKKLAVGPSATYAEAVARGLFFPISVAVLTKPSFSAIGKRRRFIVHPRDARI